MPRKMLLAALLSGLFCAAVLVGTYSSVAQEKPPAKIPAPIKPLPPAKPNEPLKPQEPAKPRSTEKGTETGSPTIMGSMPDEATRAALAKKIDLDFVDAPLQKIVDALAEQTKLEIMVDSNDETPSDSEPKQKLTVHLKGIAASSALDLVARDLGWNWFADQKTVLVTNDDRLPSVAQVYNVRDLVLAHPGAGGQDETVDYEYSPLADVITGAIPSSGWTGETAVLEDCSPFHGTFTITQDQKVQDHVARLLSALRKSRDWRAQQYDATVNAGFGIKSADETAIDKALTQGVAAQPTAAKLDDLAEWIRKTYGIAVHIDAHARAAGLPNTAVAIGGATPDAAAAAPGATASTSPAPPDSVVGLPLGRALDEVFADSKLAYTVCDEVLLITVKDDEKSLRSVRVYPVGDMIGGDVDKDGVDEEYARLLDVITRSVDPDSWATLDKPKSGTAFITYLPQGRAVICTHSRSAHERVAEMLAKVRKAIDEQGTSATKLSATTESTKDGSHPMNTKIYKLNADLPADDFVAVVKDLIDPESWAKPKTEKDSAVVPVAKHLVEPKAPSGEAYIHGVPGAIIVKQTGPIQKRVEKLLIDLGAIPDPKKVAPSGTPTLVGKRKST